MADQEPRYRLVDGSGTPVGSVYWDGTDVVMEELTNENNVRLESDGTFAADSVNTGKINSAVAIKSESDLTGLTSGQSGYIPPETTVNLTSEYRPPSNVDIDIYGTLRQANGADINAQIINFLTESNVTIRLFGTIDGNAVNQSASTTGLAIEFNDGSVEPSNNSIFGPGDVVGMQGNQVVNDNGGSGLFLGGFTVKNWTPNALNNSFISWAAGNDTSDNLVVENITVEGSTFGGTAGDGDIVTGPFSDQVGAQVRYCDFNDIPRRGIQGAQRAHGNRFVNPASPGGGGDAIASCRFITGNELYGTFDSSGDNGIVLFGNTVCVGNYVEGFSNNGIRLDNGTGIAQLFIVLNNWCVDNNQDGTANNGNINLAATNTTGGFIVGKNVCYGNAIDPLNNLRVASSVENGRVTENVATGATTEIDDSSPASVAVTDNITI